MNTLLRRWLFALLLAASLGGLAQAQRAQEPPAAAAPAVPDEPPAPPAASSSAPPTAAPGAVLPEVARSVARQIVLPARTLDYTASAGWLAVVNARGTARASIFYTAYTLTTPPSHEMRPIIFAFNGGPGAASVYLHLGTMGPRRAAIGPRGAPEGAGGAPPIVDNAETWLGLGDLVFVDPVGTGLSRAATNDGGPGDEAFWDTDSDVDAMYRFVTTYAARFAAGRPVYLVGESYGGFRAARLADSLSKVATIRLAGVVLISPALDRGAMADGRLMPLAAMLRVPTYAAVAWHHDRTPGIGRDPASRDRFIADAEAWALGQGLADVAAGDTLPPGRRKQFVAAYAHFTGLSPELAAERNGIVGIGEYARSLLRDDARMLGLYDASVSVPQRGRDPTLRSIGGALGAAIEAYLTGELGLATEAKYTTLNPRTNRDWMWLPRGTFGYPSAAQALREALIANRSLRVLIVHGRFDLVTPFAATSWAVAQLRLPPERRAAVRFAVLDGGHMMYLHDDSRRALTALASELIAGSATTTP